MCLLADQHRGIYQNTRAWLQNRGMLSQEWEEGQVLMYLPEFQGLLTEEASRQGKSVQVARILEPYKIPELQEIQRHSRSRNHQHHEHQFSQEAG